MRGAFREQSLIYLQIAQMLEDDILRGVYAPEEQVPSTNELARAYSINRQVCGPGSGGKSEREAARRLL